MLFVFDSIHDWYETQEKCDRVVSENPSLIVYCPDHVLINIYIYIYLKESVNVYISKKVLRSCWWFSSSVETYLRLVCYK